MSMTEAEKRVRQMTIFGISEATMKAATEEALKYQDPAMLAMSMISDAQEETRMGLTEDARHTLNRAKWVLSNYCRQAR